MKKILIGPSTFASSDPAPMNALLQNGFEVIRNPFGRKLTKTELIPLLQKVSGLIAGLEPLDFDVLQQSDLKVISRCGSGMSNVDLNAAKDLGIAVFSTPDAPTSAVAELALGALICLLRMVPPMDRDLHNGKWTKRTGAQLEGKTVLIIGFGRIGRRFSELLSPFRVRIMIVDPFLEENVNFPVLTLRDSLPKADIITLHASGESTILGSDEFSLVKPGAFVLNAARGGLIDEDALVKFLEEGRIQGAWIDTFLREPYTGPLNRFEQIILTPHIGSYSIECRRSMEMESVQNLIAGLHKVK